MKVLCGLRGSVLIRGIEPARELWTASRVDDNEKYRRRRKE